MSFLKGRTGEGPHQKSQFSPFGAGSSPAGRGTPHGQPWAGCQTCTLEICPKNPAWISSMLRRRLPEALPWLPVWVTTFAFRDSSRSARASASVRVSGFSQYTCRPARMAAVQMGACQWSGVATTTASRDFSFSSSTR